jgi:hypothetical protein
MEDIKMKTCISCKYGNLKSDIWYDQHCEAPAVRKVEETNPVTGKSQYRGRNDLGNVYFTDNPYPFCRDINKGICKHWQKKDCLSWAKPANNNNPKPNPDGYAGKRR